MWAKLQKTKLITIFVPKLVFLNMTIDINSSYKKLTPFINRLPELFETEGETIYKARNEIKVFTVEGEKVVVKAFKVPHIINQIAYSLFRPSKALRSYRYALELQKRGFLTPTPIAYIQLFEGVLLKRSFYVSGYTEGVTMRREFNYNYSLTEHIAYILKAFATYTARLHDAGIYHLDYSNGNILYTEEGGDLLFELVDLNRIRFKKVTAEMGWKSFHRLDFSLEMLEIAAREYALQRHLDVEESIVKITAYNLRTMKPIPIHSVKQG
ncbi:hypothetical protein AGMMS49574_28150 [Bacteroidia bacterium]|nr:hypothetical protein AGMMS49574_28150 [Bacteroidia bacterium]